VNGWIILINKEFYAKKNRSKFLNLTIIPTFAFPKKTVDQCDVGFWDE
jgi:hypothetical protein